MNKSFDYETKANWLGYDGLREHYQSVIRHPVWQALYDKPLSARARMRLFLILPEERFVDMTYADFVAELALPNGGYIGSYRQVGKVTIEELRRACFPLEPIEYGYA